MKVTQFQEKKAFKKKKMSMRRKKKFIKPSGSTGSPTAKESSLEALSDVSGK